MAIFKYVPPERIDIIERCEMRFTQPSALNDPFELRPQFETLIAEFELLAQLKQSPVDLGPMVAQAYGMLPEAYRNLIPLEVAEHHIAEFMKTEDARDAAAEGIEVMLSMFRDGAPQIRETIYRAFNSNVGMLSLSELADHHVMWAHYGASHRGLVLCFDEQHPFFNRKRTENDEFYFLRKVVYDDNPVRSFAETDGDALLITKGTQWAYEHEWRMLVPLKDAARSLTINGDAVHLFSFPCDSLRAVILGAYATSTLEDSVRKLTNDRSDLCHVRVSRAILDLDTRSVKVSWQ